ncbi:zinc metalloprotease [Nocardioides donggukensis]|uniref:Matrixin family metalloprotease n=1 Tax=Nocardioides donggukensis TaxID=2774019 RepID=A0A927Q0E7_9ACTN|nr:hypothetical protein [Nocardioides donggukensis]MBD8870555.1 hypothetical protein [Nocardioides donggukensis]
MWSGRGSGGGSGRGSGRGPFESWARARRKREMLRRLEELDRLDEMYGLGATRPEGTAPRSRRQRERSRRRGSLLAMAATGLLVLGVLAVHPDAQQARSLVGLGPAPLVEVPLLDEGDGSYAFLATQPGSDKAPVAYDPCRTIEVAVNPDGAPDGHLDLVRAAMRSVSEASGLQFALVDETTERPTERRRTRDPGRYGSGFSPVLVAWADASEMPGLAGDVAGLGGSATVTELGRSRYVTGAVTIDTASTDRLLTRPGGVAQLQAIIDHEFGHLVGLDHVADRGELMHAENSGQLTWGPGDLAGLSRLGRGDCF